LIVAFMFVAGTAEAAHQQGRIIRVWDDGQEFFSYLRENPCPALGVQLVYPVGSIMMCQHYCFRGMAGQQAAEHGLPMLTRSHLTRPGTCGALKCFEIAYWRGVEDGLFPLN